jgi:hypothetical protein
MDFSQVPDLQIDAEISGDINVAIAEHIETRLRDLHSCMPGRIVSFNSAKQTAVVQPCIKSIFVTKKPGQNAVVSQLNLPLCVDVPIQFPGGGGFFLTFPVMAGDECLLQFSERAIEFWFQNGGIQLPSDYRLHDLSDAIATVGLNSQPNSIPNFNAAACELRTRDGNTYVRVEAGQVTIKGNLIVTGTVVASGNVTGQGTSLHTHIHSGVQTGGSDTGVPV